MKVINNKNIGQILFAIILFAIIESAYALPAGFTEQVVLPDAPQTLAINFLPDGRMLSGQKDGVILISDPSGTPPFNSFVYLTIQGVKTTGELGLYDIVLDPQFETNGYFYVAYNRFSDRAMQITRYQHLENNGLLTSRADPDSEVVIWIDPHPQSSCCHHSAGMEFLPDGKLYFVIGDKAKSALAQDVSNTAGKVFRINSDGSIPTDNPDFSALDANPVPGLWAFGLRNPFRISFDEPTNRLLIAEVGGNTQATSREDLHVGAFGVNYGWPFCEGSICNPVTPPYPAPFDAYHAPVFSYPHSGVNASITGGVVYRGQVFPSEYRGVYFYGDYARRLLRYVLFDQSGNAIGDFDFHQGVGGVVVIEQGPDGALYYANIFNGNISRIMYTAGNQPPVISSVMVDPQTSIDIGIINFSGTVSDPENDQLTYLWDFGDGSQSTDLNVSHDYLNKGEYVATLQVSDGNTVITSDPLLIQIGLPPQITISSPVNNDTFVATQEIVFAATASDSDGVLSDANYHWEIYFWHEDHIHPGESHDAVTAGIFTVPDIDHDFDGNTRYEFRLVVTDSDGLKTSESVFIFPEKINMTIDSTPSGQTVYLDGIPRQTPYTIDTLINFRHELNIDPSICSEFQDFSFSGWSDGGEANHTIAVPPQDISYTAEFQGTGQLCQITSCGMPDFISGIEQSIFVWKDCSSNQWSVRATAGGSSNLIEFEGLLDSLQPITDVVGFSLEPEDILTQSILEEVFFKLKLIDVGIDGFDFYHTDNSNTCFNLMSPPDADIFLGQYRFRMKAPFDLDDLGVCGNNVQVPAITVNDTNAGEMDAIVDFTISLSEPSLHPVVIDYSTSDLSAVDGSDFDSISGSLLFSPGEVVKIISVNLIDDNVYEPVEEFHLILNRPINAVLSDGEGTATIYDNDVTSGNVICGVPVYNAGAELAVYLYIDCQTQRWHLRVTGGGKKKAVTYRGEISSTMSLLDVQGYSLESSDSINSQVNQTNYVFKLLKSGQDGLDFTLAPGAISCFDHKTPTAVPVYVGQNKLLTQNAFVLETMGPCGDGIPQTPIISTADVVVSESADRADVTINLNPASTDQVTVDYSTVDGTALTGIDFQAMSGTLVFAAGETQKTISIAVIDDAIEEQNEQFIVVLSNAVNANLGTLNSTVSIFNDDFIASPSCGAPIINYSGGVGVYIWEDCFNGEWHVRATSGGSQTVIKFKGSITSSAGYNSWSGFNLESSDVFSVNNDQIDFTLKAIKTGFDGFSFTYPTGSVTCFELSTPPGMPVKLGVNMLPVNMPFDLQTLGPCDGSPPPPPPPPANDIECGQPSYNSSSQKNFYIWKDCAGSGAWHVRTTAAGSTSSIKYSGSLSATTAFQLVAPYSIEGSDLFVTQMNEIEFILKLVGTGEDGFDFTLPSGGNACLDVKMPSGTMILLGSGKSPVIPPFDLLMKQFCQ